MRESIKTKNRFYNPIWQNAVHIDALNEKLGKLYPQLEFFSLVVFSERCELKKIINSELDTFVFQRQELHYWLKQIRRATKCKCLAEDDVEKIAKWLTAHECPDEEVRQ